ILGTSRYTNIATTADVTVTVTDTATIRRHLYGAGYGNYTAKKDGILLVLSGNARCVNPSGSSDYICAGANSGSVTGDLCIRIRDNAQVAGNVYGGGYFGNVTGNSTIEMSGGSVGVTLSPGPRTGTLTGDATLEITGGRLTGSAYGPSLNGGNISETSYGSVTGRSTFILDGGAVAGTLQGGAHAGSTAITLKSGSLGGTAEQIAAIDLSGDKALSVGGTLNVETLTGGGTLTLSGALTASAASGEIDFAVSGTPQSNFTYITVSDPTSTLTVNYTPDDDETLVRALSESALTYTVTYPDRYDTTHIRINYYNPHGTEEIQPNLVVSSSTPSDPDRVPVSLVKGVEDGIPYAEADLAPGTYYYKAYYNGATDYELHYFVVSGKEAEHVYNIPLEPYVADSYMETVTAMTTEEMMASFFNNEDLTGFETSPTPTFTEHTDDYRAFMSNEELLAYVDTLSAPYLYKFAFDLGTEYNNQMPVLVFTKDEIAPGATIEEVAATVRSGGVREIWQIDGGIHGNEPTGPEAALWFATELCGEYGENVLDRFGAIVIIPDVNPDNSERFKREYADGVNANRDLVSLIHVASQKQAYVVDLFMPTVFVDLHEDGANETVNIADYSVDSIVDIRFDVSCLPNGGVGDPNGLIDGTNPLAAHRDYQTVRTLITEVAARSGLRTAGYHPIQYNPGVSTSYAKTRGAYSFLFEAMRLWTGKQRFARSVFAEKTALMALCDIIYEANGAFAAEVALGRAKTAVTVYDEHNYFATAMASGGSATYTLISPSAYLNGRIKDAAHTDTFTEFDTVTAYRSMPTGYVLPANVEHIDEILALCEKHDLEYLRLQNGSTLTLHRYTSMSVSGAAVGAAEEVTFADGAYLFLTDNEDAYLMAYLFEPDSFSKGSDTKVSLVQMALLSADDALYRSQTDYLRAATASMLVSTDAGDLAALEDGEIFTSLQTRADGGEFTALRASDELPDGYTAVLNAGFTVNCVYEIRGEFILPVAFESDAGTVSFAAEAGKVYAASAAPLVTYGDAGGDGQLSLGDALRILRALADDTVELDKAAADIDHSAS
ncbi:MAG: hypothetical protein IJU41_09780, partial [Clostridia bacterium]|nr:hypothetical protein [Clostridia bacterium]